MNKIYKLIINNLPLKFYNYFLKQFFYNQINKDVFKSSEIEWEMLENWVKKNDTVIDVGANIGRYSLKLSNLVGVEGQVISFEPLKFAFETLEYFIFKKNITNILLLNFAISDKVKLVDFIQHTGPGNYFFETFTMSKIIDIPSRFTNKKLAINLDSLNLNKVSLIKIDVEGHELEVLKGAKNLISTYKPVIILEASTNETEIHNFLINQGYLKNIISEKSRNVVYIQESQK
jgi:FkbM family methyltransferase